MPRPAPQLWLLILSLVVLGGCAAPGLSDYAGVRPKLDPRAFFDGHLEAQGIVRNYRGEVIRTFDAKLQGTWSADGTGRLHEQFVYNDGEVQTRTWQFKPVDGGYRATAGDVVKPGIWRWRGNAAHMQYVLRIPYDGDTLDLSMDDWMYAVTPNTVINQTQMSKWGFNVGEVVLVIRRLPAGNPSR